MADILLEICVDSAEGLSAAIAGGADRIELCAALDVGGLTPSAGLMQMAAGCGVPVLAMIRPRSGGFDYSGAELAVMRADIATARAVGLAGVVFGATRGGALDTVALADLAAAAHGLDTTLHRAADLCADAEAVVDTALSLGFGRILSSGGAASAVQGLARLQTMTARAKGRIVIMPGSGITSETIHALRPLGCTEVHASCGAAGPAAPKGFGSPRMTSSAQVRALKAALLTWT